MTFLFCLLLIVFSTATYYFGKSHGYHEGFIDGQDAEHRVSAAIKLVGTEKSTLATKKYKDTLETK